MTRIKSALSSVLLFMFIAFSACQKSHEIIDPTNPSEPDEPEIRPELILDAEELVATSEGGVFKFDFRSTRKVSLSISPEQDWCKAMLSSTEEEYSFVLIVNVAAMDLKEDRSATIVLSAPECESRSLVVKQERKKASTNSLTSLVLKAAPNSLSQDLAFSYDEATKTFSAKYLKWIDKAQPEMLIPEFVTDGETVLVNGQPVVSGQTAISFADDFDLVVKAENGDENTYRVSFNCPQINTELPVIRIHIPVSSITDKKTYRKTKFDIYRPGSDEGRWTASDAEIEIRGRGNSTWGLPKKPYRIKFPEKFSPIGLNHAKAKSWVLLAHDMDKSLLRNHLGFELSRILFSSSEKYHDEAALDFTPCSQMVNVYSGNNYHGVYQMSDQMEVAKGRIGLDKLVATDGSDPDKITGGHLIETNIHHDEPYPVSFTSSRGIYMDHKYPKDDDMDVSQYKYIEDFIRKAEAALYSSNFTDSVNGWRKWFDEKALADFIIVKEFAGDMDGYTSTYFYKRRGVDKIFFGPVWDLDKGWNNDKRTPHGNTLTQLMIYGGFYMPPFLAGCGVPQVCRQEVGLQKGAAEVQSPFRT